MFRIIIVYTKHINDVELQSNQSESDQQKTKTLGNVSFYLHMVLFRRITP